MYRELKKEIANKDPVMKRIMTAPGVGLGIAAAFRATIDDPHRFRIGEHVASCKGLVPSVYQSGEVEVKGQTYH